MTEDALSRMSADDAWRDRVASALAALAQRGARGTLFLVDVDALGALNDTHGRDAGDAVLRELAALLRVSLRGSDECAHLGDDEFAALLVDCPLEHGLEVAERLARAIASHGLRLDTGGTVREARVTASIGVAAFPEHGRRLDELLSAAARALVHVKAHGRDGVAASAPLGEPLPAPSLATDRFVGRADEYARLRRHLDEAITGAPSLVIVSGEAGIGKTTLVRQLEATVRLRGGSLVTGRSGEGEVQAPFAAWADILAGIARTRAVERREWYELPQLVPSLRAEGAAAQIRGNKYALFEEVVAYLREAAAQRPLVLLFDDAQWADPGTWELLEHVVPALDTEHLLIAATVRADAAPATLQRVRRLALRDRVHEIRLERLTRDEVRQWLVSAFHGQAVGPELLAFLYGHTEGNPLFVVQALRALVDDGAVWFRDGMWQWRPLDDIDLPVAVSDLITRRLARLSARTRELLAVCAVLGREFETDLAVAAGAEPLEHLVEALDEAVRAGVLQPTVLRRGEQYAFTHATLGALLRAALPTRRLQAVHGRVARALAQRDPEAVAEIAAHYDRAGMHSEAYRFALLAAERATAVYAPHEALDYLTVAKRHERSARDGAEVAARMAEASELAGEYDAALAYAKEALLTFTEQREARRVLTLRRLEIRVRGLLGAPATVTLAGTDALVLEARAIHAHDEEAALLTLCSRLHQRLGDGASAIVAATSATAAAERSGDQRVHAEALVRLGICLEPEHPDTAVEHYRRALELYRVLGDPRGQSHCHNNLGIVYARRGEVAYAEREMTTAITLGRTISAPDLSGLFTLNLGVIHLKRGDLDRARDLIGESLAQFAAVKNSERQVFALLNLAHLDREQGEVDGAAALYDAVLSLARRIGQDDVEISALAGAALVLRAAGRPDEAAPHAAEASARTAARPDWFQGRELVEALELGAWCDAGRAADALDRYERSMMQAEAADLFSAVWLAAEVVPRLAAADAGFARTTLWRYARLAGDRGYTGVAGRCADAARRLAEGGTSVA